MKKTKVAWIGILSLAFAACDKKEEEEASTAPEASGRLSQLAAERDRPKSAVSPAEIADAVVAADEIATPDPVESAPAETAGGGAVPLAPGADASPATRPMSREEREAARARAREERMARVGEQMAARWAERDADGDGRLSQSELPERMQRRFADLDTNGDGFIDAQEQQAMIQRMSERMSGAGGRGDWRDRRGGGRREGSGRRRD